MPEQAQPTLQPAPLWRRLAAMFYDSILILAIVIVTSGLYHGLINNWLLGLEDAPAGFNPLLSTILLFLIFFFFAHFWGKNGQTLGMQAWRIQLRSTLKSQRITLLQALLRFMVAIPSLALCGMGFFWMLIDKDQKTWHDRYSDSEVVLLPKK